jgi:hypothetical protein
MNKSRVFLTFTLIAGTSVALASDPATQQWSGMQAPLGVTRSAACNAYPIPEHPGKQSDRPGEPIVLEHRIHIWGNQDSNSLIFLPDDLEQDTFPLVVILHGRGFDYDEYSSIQAMLAANGIASASIQYSELHYESDYDEEAFYEIFDKHLQQIYGDIDIDSHPLHGKVNPNLAIAGHSMGGGLAVYASNRLIEEDKYPVKLRSVMALAPNPQADKGWHIEPAVAQGLLVMLGSNDADTGVNSPWNSGFYTYDQSGYLRNEYSNGYYPHAFTKSMIYMKDAEHGTYLDSDASALHDAAVAYVVAYARWSLLDDQVYRTYFKHQHPVSDSVAVSVLHSDPFRRVLANFEGPSKYHNTLGGKNAYEEILADQDVSVHFNDGSSHFSQALRLKWDKTATAPQAVFDLPMPYKGGIDYRNLSGFDYLSFRIGQMHDPSVNSTDFDMRVRIEYRYNGTKYTQAKRLSDFGHVPFPFAHDQASETKSVMNTILFPLCAFDEIPFADAKVTAIRFEFGLPGSEQGDIQIDSLEFL